VDKEDGIIATSSDEFYIRSLYMFLLFVDNSSTVVRDKEYPSSPPGSGKTGIVDTHITVDTVSTLLTLLNLSSGNPKDISEVNQNNDFINSRTLERRLPKVSSRNYSTFKRSSINDRSLFKYYIIMEDDNIITLFSKYPIKITNSLYRKIALDLKN
jgi:hypothetical protein